MKSVVRYLFAVASLAVAMPVGAQRQQAVPVPSLPSLSPEATAALDELSARYAGESGLTQGWFRDRTVMYYDFGVVPPGQSAARVLWPIHGFDMKGNPVAIRGQRPIFSTLPGMLEYTGVWRLVYVVTADKAQPNILRDMASADAAVRGKTAYYKETDLLLNLPLVPRGTTLARDSTGGGMTGWFEGRDVQYFDFGQAVLAPVPMWRFARGKDGGGQPNVLPNQNSIVDSIPVAPAYPDLWEIRFVDVDTAYVVNSLKSAAAVRAANLQVGDVNSIRNLPIAFIDGAPIQRTASPLRAFADNRSPFPPKPTLLTVPQ
ncbi:MAG: hypothetical protein ACRENU_14350 [Gemmatimonadaceae bacterium]